MKVLGISDSHDSGIALIEDGNITFLINEERINKLKLCYGFPRGSLKELFKWTKLSPQDIDYITLSSKYLEFRPVPIPMKNIFEMPHNKRNKRIMGKLSPFLGIFFRTNLWILLEKIIFSFLFKKRVKEIKRILKKEYGFKCPILIIDHHTCHAASAYFTSGKENALIITSDGSGDCLSSTISLGIKNKIKKIKNIGSFNSIGNYYGYVTTLCGFTAGKHEGKITGLAAHGKPIYQDLFKKMIFSKRGKFFNVANIKHQSALKKIEQKVSPFKREDLASSIQIHLEEEFLKFVDYWINKTKQKNVVLAGGIFANVLLNQRIHDYCNIESIYIHPHMGDGGLALGAALYFYNKKINSLNQKLEHVYYGPGYSDKEIELTLKQNKLKYIQEKFVEKKIAEVLAKGKVVARFNGRMEYGPRALGNRTILFQPTDSAVNDWLNKNLKRSEFMPFAPVTLTEEVNKCYLNIKGAEQAAKFMTITFNCTDWMKKNCPGVVHLDGTARPQFISEKDNPSYYRILKEYQKLTGLPVLINTSFNMHESPIVCTPQDAIDSFKDGHLDYLAIGDYLIKPQVKLISNKNNRLYKI